MAMMRHIHLARNSQPTTLLHTVTHPLPSVSVSMCQDPGSPVRISSGVSSSPAGADFGIAAPSK